MHNSEACLKSNELCPKYKLIYVFASWCPYCSHKIPTLLQLHKTHQNNLSMYFISLDESPNALQPLSSKLPKDLKIFIMPKNEIMDFFSQLNLDFQHNIPAFALLDTQNNVVINMMNSLGKIENVLNTLQNPSR
jgi:thiol-disulfide isomerase/thioredoxin